MMNWLRALHLTVALLTSAGCTPLTGRDAGDADAVPADSRDTVVSTEKWRDVDRHDMMNFAHGLALLRFFP